jgi:hypothetical protein
MAVEDEIDLMIKTLEEGETVKEETSPDETPKTEEKSVEKVEEKTSETKSEEKSDETKVEPTETKVEETKVEPTDERDKTIEHLRNEIAELKSKPSTKEPETKVESDKVDEQDFVKDLDLDEVTRDPKEFNKVLNNIYKKAIQDTESRLMNTLPDVVQSRLTMIQAMQTATENFYKENKDLEPFKNAVSVTFGEVAKANQGKTYAELMSLTEAESRRRLGLPKKAIVKETKKDPPPPLQFKQGTKAGKIGSEPSKNSFETELDAMNSALES